MFILTDKRQCSKCGEWKNKSEIHRDARFKDLLSDVCEACFVAKKRKRKAKYQAGYRTKNPDKVRNAINAWYQNNVQKVVIAAKAWVQSNPNKRKKIAIRYNKNHPDIVKANVHNRRARVKGNGGTITAQEWQALKEFYNFTCLCCERKEPEIKLTPDHVIPIAKGGKNSIENIQPLCLFCNMSKGVKVVDYR